MQAVPIVPFNEAQEDAINSRQFKKLLKSLRLQPPANEQVTTACAPDYSVLCLGGENTLMRFLSDFAYVRDYIRFVDVVDNLSLKLTRSCFGANKCELS